MMKQMQRLGRSLMLPIATLPIAALMLGIGYWIDPAGWGANNQIAAFLVQGGAAIIDFMPILFAVGIAVGMAEESNGTAALAGIVSWLIITNLLTPDTVTQILGRELSEVNALAFARSQNVFIGILCGIIGAMCYNRFKNLKLPDAFAFFSGKRSVAIVTGGMSIVVAFILMLIWPLIFGGLVAFGTAVTNLGAIGAGIFGFFNRLLIPLGLHHALNAVFYWDIAGINDIPNFWAGTGILGHTGLYQTGYFPIMMFGLPGAALAMYHTAKANQKKIAAGVLFSGAIASILTGVTEPIEFAFMFLAPVLFVIHAGLTAVSMTVMALLPIRAGYNFSAGFIDLLLSSNAPMALNPWMVIPVGIVFFAIYYFLFRIVIVKFNLKTPGREDEDYVAVESKLKLASGNFAEVGKVILEGLGGAGNISSIESCATRLRVEVKDYVAVDEKKIKSAGVSGVIRPSKTSVQVIVGTQVGHVEDEVKKLL